MILYLSPLEFEELKQLKPEHGIQHQDLDAAKLYYATCYKNVDNYLQKFGINIESNFVHDSRQRKYIEVEGLVNGSKTVIQVYVRYPEFKLSK